MEGRTIRRLARTRGWTGGDLNRYGFGTQEIEAVLSPPDERRTLWFQVIHGIHLLGSRWRPNRLWISKFFDEEYLRRSLSSVIFPTSTIKSTKGRSLSSQSPRDYLSPGTSRPRLQLPSTHEGETAGEPCCRFRQRRSVCRSPVPEGAFFSKR